MDFKFDYDAAIQQLKDMATIQVITSLAPDEKTRDMLRNSLAVFVNHGISAEVGLNILTDLSNKKAISDVVTNGIEILLYGESGRTRRSSPSGSVSYRSLYGRRRLSPPARSGYSLDDIVLETRGEAEDVLACMDELVELYGFVSVADLYDLVGITGNYTDNKYGWTNIRNAEPIRVRDGYLLKLPKVTTI